MDRKKAEVSQSDLHYVKTREDSDHIHHRTISGPVPRPEKMKVP